MRTYPCECRPCLFKQLISENLLTNPDNSSAPISACWPHYQTHCNCFLVIHQCKAKEIKAEPASKGSSPPRVVWLTVDPVEGPAQKSKLFSCCCWCPPHQGVFLAPCIKSLWKQNWHSQPGWGQIPGQSSSLHWVPPQWYSQQKAKCWTAYRAASSSTLKDGPLDLFHPFGSLDSWSAGRAKWGFHWHNPGCTCRGWSL